MCNLLTLLLCFNFLLPTNDKITVHTGESIYEKSQITIKNGLFEMDFVGEIYITVYMNNAPVCEFKHVENEKNNSFYLEYDFTGKLINKWIEKPMKTGIFIKDKKMFIII